jgi:non-homologous end joining protein Ku
MLVRSTPWPRVRVGRAIFVFRWCRARLPSTCIISCEKVSFNRINRKTGNRLKQLNVDSETGDVVRREDIARGFEVTKGENEDIDAVQIESTRTIEIDQFVPRGGDR